MKGYSNKSFKRIHTTITPSSSSSSSICSSSCCTSSSSSDPLLLRALRGEKVERTPVWLMRQAGRHMQVYRDLAKQYPSFRQRSENPDLATGISLQPWRKYKTDGCILFSDILTPLPGMGVNFEIENEGPKLGDWTTKESLKKLKTLDPTISTPFVGETLRNLRREVGNEATVLGFIGAPFTLASYMIEGGSSEDFLKTKQMMYNSPETFHNLLNHLQENIANYAIYQIENGAQAIQIFDSWAGVLSPIDYDKFALEYQQKVIQKIKSVHPNVPIILFIAKGGAVLEKMAKSGADCVSLDSTVTITDARQRMNLVCHKSSPSLAIQGNLDPMVLLGPKDVIRERTEAILREGNMNHGRGYVMNLGHGVNTNTPEENVEYFVNLVKNYKPTTTTTTAASKGFRKYHKIHH